MIDVKIFFLSFIEDITEKKEQLITLEDEATLHDLLQKVKKQFGRELTKLIFTSSGEIKKYILIGLNGKSVKEFAIKLTQGDEVSILPAIAGG